MPDAAAEEKESREAGADESGTEAASDTAAETAAAGTEIPGLTFDHTMPLKYAQNFTVEYYQGGYALIMLREDGRFLVVPEGMSAPEGLDEDIVVLQQPIQNIYLVATSAMDFFASLEGMDSIRLSGTRADGWYVEEARAAMEAGKILYAGKYNAPDYEQIVAQNCGLSIESTMIYHTPEVKEKLEEFGIPVLVEHSSYEAHPLGRAEWIKLYGVLLGKEELADTLFEAQTEKLSAVESQESTGKTVAFFYISSNGYVNVRKSGDYVAKMIELAGGSYIFPDLGEGDNALSTMNMQMEDFYAGAKDADFIIYNSTIDGELQNISELLKKSELLAGFKAVKNGNVWCTTQNLFQKTTGLVDMIVDIHTMLSSTDPVNEQYTYMYHMAD
ncbi:MAG: ABC transporter substrate-binding protein [Lachnospiraceae bacterium]|nr:ABC transporter substrate-binding protein [Lachnospiraceae bacterium]